MSFFSSSAQLFKKNLAPSCLTHFCTILYPLSLMVSNGLYLPLIMINNYYSNQLTCMLKTARIYLLVGFFGSGKTTFIRRLLAKESSEKYAIIQNEFAEGEMGIEQPLIMDQTGTPFSSFLQLPNGCICCSAKNDLVAAVEYIINNTPVRNIVVETNGLADPASSIKQFWFDEEMKINAELHSVITMVSARKWDENSKNETFVKQVVFANKIMVSFVDVMGQEKFNAIREELRNMNCQVAITRSDQIDLEKMLHDSTLFSKDILLKANSESNTSHHHHVRSLFIRGNCKIKDQLAAELITGELLWESGLKILRIKGILCLQGHQHVFELQGVEDLFEVKETKTPVEIYNNQTRILIVGQDLDPNTLRLLFLIEP